MGARNMSKCQRSLERGLTRLYVNYRPGYGTLSYTAQSANYTAGLVITGGTSGATAVIVSDSDAGSTGTLTITNIVGTFVNGETVTDSGTGSATANVFTLTAAAALKGKGTTSLVASTATVGLYTLTLQDAWGKLMIIKPAVIDTGTADDWVITPVTETVSTTKSITLQVFKGGTATALPSTAKLYLELVLSNSPDSVPSV